MKRFDGETRCMDTRLGGLLYPFRGLYKVTVLRGINVVLSYLSVCTCGVYLGVFWDGPALGDVIDSDELTFESFKEFEFEFDFAFLQHVEAPGEDADSDLFSIPLIT